MVAKSENSMAVRVTAASQKCEKYVIVSILEMTFFQRGQVLTVGISVGTSVL